METDVVIAVMGLTGVGKSSFIKNITGRDDIKIGHGLESETAGISSYVIEQSQERYVLVDTPGFDDTFQSDQTIGEKILAWLESSYRAGTKLNGVLYLHSIALPKMSASAFDNLCMFRKLCGHECLDHVVLATTFWDAVPPEEGEKRAKQLEEDDLLWGRMVKAGSRVVRLQNNRESAIQVLAQMSTNGKMVLEVQNEMVNEQKRPEQTAAGQLIASYGGSLNLRQQHTRLEFLREEARRRSKELSDMKEKLRLMDEHLANIKAQAENQRLISLPSRPRPIPTRACQCRLTNRARCAKCGHLIHGVFFRESFSVSQRKTSKD